MGQEDMSPDIWILGLGDTITITTLPSCTPLGNFLPRIPAISP